MKYIMHIMLDMVKFLNATRKPSIHTYHVFMLLNTPQKGGTAVVNPTTDKQI